MPLQVLPTTKPTKKYKAIYVHHTELQAYLDEYGENVTSVTSCYFGDCQMLCLVILLA